MDNNKRVKCEIWSRVVGYIRPINQWNKGKQAEYHDRKPYSVESITEDHFSYSEDNSSIKAYE